MSDRAPPSPRSRHTPTQPSWWLAVHAALVTVLVVVVASGAMMEKTAADAGLYVAAFGRHRSGVAGGSSHAARRRRRQVAAAVGQGSDGISAMMPRPTEQWALRVCATIVFCLLAAWVAAMRDVVAVPYAVVVWWSVALVTAWFACLSLVVRAVFVPLVLRGANRLSRGLRGRGRERTSSCAAGGGC